MHVCLSGMYFSTLGGQTYFGKWTREAPVVPSKPDVSADQEEEEIKRRGRRYQIINGCFPVNELSGLF